MSEWDEAESLRKYVELIKSRPHLADNPPDGTIEVLTQPEDIAAARAAARQWRADRGLPSDDLRCGVLASDPYMTFLRDAVRFADGSLGLYNRIMEGPCVAVLPLFEGQPVLIRIFRHGLRSWMWEAPRGGLEGGESFAEAARRELREEIGAEALSIESLGTYTPGGASLAIRAGLCAARIDRIGPLERAESISEAKVVSVTEMERMIADSAIEDGFTIALFARARLRGLI